MPTLNELIQERADRLESIPDAFITSVERSQIELFDELIQLLSQLDLVGGKFAINTQNLLQVNQIVNILQQTMTEGQYIDALEAFVLQYDTQTVLVNQIIEATFDTFTDNALFRQAKQNAVETTISLLDETSINSRLMTPIRQILNEAISTGMTLRDATRTLKEFMLDDENNLGAYNRYARTVAHDAFAVSDRTYANVIHEDLGVTKFKYFGGTLKDSRCFCIERTEKIWSKTQLEEWGRRENIGNCEITLKSGRKGWKGINDATTESTIFTFLGGWNCIHSLIGQRENAKTDTL